MAYFVGTQQFPSIYEAARFLAQNPQPGVTITSAPVAPAGMLTKPAPTVKQTVPVGTPSTPPKQMPGESGPFDPNAPVPTPAPAPALAPAPAPAPQQTGPVGIPSSDPTKTQPGETGPFDPNAEPPAPAPAPEPETELAPPKPLPDTKDAEPAPEPEGTTTFTFFEGIERGDANPNALYARGDATQVTEAELREYFNAQGSQMLKRAFGDFDNYLAYMTEREQLIQSGDYDVGNWDEYTGSLTEDELMILEGEDITQYGDDAQSDYTELYGERMQEQSSAYDRWVNSEANQALLSKYGVDGTMYNSDGDTFKWNGSAYVKTNKIDDSVNIGEIATLGMAIALSAVGTPAIASFLTPTGAAAGSAAAMAANATASSIMSLATQLLTTGQIDPEGALRAAATSFLSDSVMKSLRDSGIFGQIGEAANSSTTDQLIDADGNVIGQIVRDSAGNVLSSSGVSANEWFTYASELGATINEGQTLVSQIASVLPEVPEWLYDAAQTTVDAVDQLFEETRAGTGGQGGEGSVFGPIVGGGRDIFAGDAEQVEEPEEVPPEEDILADTTQEATGLEERTITEDILGEYLEPIRADITASEQRIISQTQEFLASALANLPPNISQEELRTIVEEIVANAPQAETLSEDQVDVLVNSAVDSVRVDLETAETERQEIRAGQEAIRSELSSDIQSLEERLNSLPPEIREIVTEQLENLEITDDISSVRQAVTALEEVVSNIQPGTTPEQVAEQIEQADLVTSEELETTAEGLFAAIQAMAEGQTVELTTAQSELLAEITEGDAEVIERLSQYQGQLEDYLEERDITFDTVTGELSSDIERLQQQAEEFESRTEERFEESAQAQVEIYQGLLNRLDEFRRGAEVDLSETEIRVLSEVTGVEERLLQQASENAEEFNALLAQQGIQFEEVTDSLRADIAASEQRTGERITGLEERMDANAIEQLAQLTGLRVEFLEGISNVEAAAIASSRGLSDQITEEITGIRGETAAQIEGMSERLTERISEYETQTGQQLEMAAEERAVLGGQLGTLTSDVARVAEDVIRANGRIENMDAESRQRYDELGLSIEELSLRVGVNLEALQEGMLTQESAMRELIEETAQQTEERVGVQITGLGEQIAGIGEGVTGLGQALGIGLLGLAGAQPTAQEIAAAMPRQPVEFDPFLKGLSPFQPLTPLSLSPIQEKDATSELNKFIGRQTGMLV